MGFTVRITEDARRIVESRRSTCCPSVVAASGDAPVLFDSGVRTGSDVIKALAMGARAVGVGRPYLYGLALAGAAGVEHVVRSILAEADLFMAVNGYPTIAQLRAAGTVRVAP
jgi:lactate 2-monooxygenase